MTVHRTNPAIPKREKAFLGIKEIKSAAKNCLDNCNVRAMPTRAFSCPPSS
jgi:hypothetical protein